MNQGLDSRTQGEEYWKEWYYFYYFN